VGLEKFNYNKFKLMKSESEVEAPKLVHLSDAGEPMDLASEKEPGFQPYAKTEPLGQILIIAVCVVAGVAFFIHVLASPSKSSTDYSNLDLSKHTAPSPTGQVAGAQVGPPSKPSLMPKATATITTSPTPPPATTTPKPTSTPMPTPKPTFVPDTPTPTFTPTPTSTPTPTATDTPTATPTPTP
jgi:hypothetical protein